MTRAKRYVEARYRHTEFERHRQSPDIANGSATGAGGTKAATTEPRQRGEGFGEAGRRGAARDHDRAAEHKRDRAMHSSKGYEASGMEKAMGAHADKLHPVR